MTTLSEPTLGQPRTPPAAPPSPVLTGALAGMQAVAASLVLALAPVVLAWVTGSGSTSSWSQAVRVGLDAWLLALRVPIEIDGGRLTIAPVGLTLLPLAACWLSARRMGRALDPNGERIAAGFGRAVAQPTPRAAQLVFVAVWAGAAAAVAAVAGTPVARPVLWIAPLAAALISAVGVVTGTAAWQADGLLAGCRLVLHRVADRVGLPQPVRRLGGPAVRAVTVVLAGAGVVLLAGLVLSTPGMIDVQQALEPGWVGGLVLVLVQMLFLPNAVVWVAALLTGAGFAVGEGTSVTLGASALGPLPAFPMLAMLPGPGELPDWLWLALLVPIGAGVSLGRAVVARAPHGRPAVRLAGDMLAAGLLAGALLGALAWLAGGAAGPGRLDSVGPRPVLVAALFAAEVVAGALVVLAVRPLVPRLPGLQRGLERLRLPGREKAGDVVGLARAQAARYWRGARRYAASARHAVADRLRRLRR